MHNYKIKLRRSYGGYLHYYIAFCLVFFATSASFLVLIPGTIVTNLLAIIFVGFLLVCSTLKGIDRNSFIWICIMVAVTLINGYYINNLNIVGINFVPYLTFIGALLMCWIGTIRNDWVDIYLDWSLRIYLFYALATIILRYTPNLYINYVVPLFSYNSDRLLSLYRNGCMAGLTSHYSTNAMLLSVGTIISFTRLLLYRRKKIDYITFMIMVLALLFTGKRGHCIFVLVSMLIMYYFSGGKKTGTRWIKLLRALIFIVIACIIVYEYIPSARVVFERINEIFIYEDITNNRIRWWRVAIEYFKQNYLFGIGWGNFYDLCGQVEGYYANTHNVYLQLLCETGIVGFAVYFLWMLKNIRGTIKNFIRIRNSKEGIKDEKAYYFIGFSLAYQILFILYCFTGNPLYDKEMFIPYFVSCAISLYYGKHMPSAGTDNIKEMVKNE